VVRDAIDAESRPAIWVVVRLLMMEAMRHSFVTNRVWRTTSQAVPAAAGACPGISEPMTTT